MNTFLPYPDYYKSMQSLDKSRLGNQVWREGITLIRGGWPNHPASKMWRGHFYHLGLYLLDGIKVLAERGKYYDKIEAKIRAEMEKHDNNQAAPLWIGDERFHSGHRSHLLSKGLIDSICDTAKTRLKIKKIDDWTKKICGKTKNQLKWQDSFHLHDVLREQIGPFEIKNHYDQFGWEEDPAKPYVWPTNK